MGKETESTLRQKHPISMANKKNRPKRLGTKPSDHIDREAASARTDDNLPRPTNLTSKIEIYLQQALPEKSASDPSLPDVLDHDLASHIQIFAKNWQKDLELPPISLLSLQEAQEAINVFSEKLSTLEKKLKLVRSLKTLLGNS